MSNKITKNLSAALRASRGGTVRCTIDVAIDHDRLPMSSFAARATARDAAILAGITAIMGAVQAWEASNGSTVEVAIRATDGIVEVAATRDLVEAIGALPEVAAIDAPFPSGLRAASTRTPSAATSRATPA